MKYLSLFIFVTGLAFLRTAAADALRHADFIGFASTTGAELQSCDSFQPPTMAEAETSADQQAATYCVKLGSTPVRISAFTYSTNNCVWGGPQYHYPSDFAYAEAHYRCE